MRRYCFFSLFFFFFLQSCSFLPSPGSQDLHHFQTELAGKTAKKKQGKADAIARSYTAFLHGNQAEQEKHYEQALHFYKKALDYTPDNKQIFEKLLLMLFLLQRDEESAIYIKEALAQKPEDSYLLQLLANTYLIQGKKEESIALYRHLQKLQPDDESIVTELASIYLQQEMFAYAVAVLEEFIHRHPKAYDSRILLAQIHNQRQNYGEAIAALTRDIPTEKTPFIYGALASLYQIQKENDKALSVLQQGIAAHPSSFALLYDLGLLYENQGKHDLALSTMEKVIAVYPNHAGALNFIGYSWAESNINLEQAHNYILRANSIKPDNGFILDSLGWVLFRLGRFSEANETLQKALLLLPENDLILEHLGDVNLALQHYKIAQEYYTKAYNNSLDARNQQRIEKKLEKRK